ncbi:MAG: type I DNA topoisomerase [Lentisphaeria bacterium]
MNKKLVIVESPAKARTIGRFLGSDVNVLASMGHVRDLPKNKLGVDIANNFNPDYELTTNGKKIIKALKSAAENANEIYLATDPDREGEAIAWHLKTLLDTNKNRTFHRIAFHEITKNAIQNALENPSELSMGLIDAQQARRVLDRIVGYQVSPMLWKNIHKGTSAGRVQSIALRLIVEREREIQAFQSEEYWNIEGYFQSNNPETKLKTYLARINGKKKMPQNKEQTDCLVQALKSSGASHTVSKVTSTPRKQHAAPPFITSTLQQAASSFLKIGTKQTMQLAQQLYEGVEIGSGGSVGLITYMRTDSVNIAKEAQNQAKEYITHKFGPEYVPAKPNNYRSRKTAQEAHEAIRPTDINRIPDDLKEYLSPQQLKLYRLIWNRFVASQMAAAKQLDHVIEIESKGGELDTFQLKNDKIDKKSSSGTICTFHAAARETKFQGYLIIYNIRDLGEEDEMDEFSGILPPMKIGIKCDLLKLLTKQNFTSPPSRFSEASLVKALEQNGVGRPSTFATTVSTVIDRKYVEKAKSSLVPTELGFSVNDYLVKQMPNLFDIGFTAQMENELDEIEEGKINWINMLTQFYKNFQNWIGKENLPTVIKTSELQEILNHLFPEDYSFAPPEKHGTITYDDKKFHTSINEQLSKGKDLSDRQRNALLNMIARYAAKDENVHQYVDETVLENPINALIKKNAEKEALPKEEQRPEILALMTAMEKITWKKPVKRGRKTYDDGKFFRSLKRQADNGKNLSQAQILALLKLAKNYASLIEDFEKISQAVVAAVSFGDKNSSAQQLVDPVAIKAEAEKKEKLRPKIELLFKLAEEIHTWKETTSKRKNAFDEQKFLESLKDQFANRNSLSEKQTAALCKMLKKYEEQIPDFNEHTETLESLLPPPPKKLDIKCPLCGAPLVQRYARGKSFIGCSAFPKCRYISSEKDKKDE